MHVRAGPESLVFEEAPVPAIGDEEVLIRVKAAGITPTEFTWNSTFTTADGRNRLPIVPSFDVSGMVNEKGKDVSDLSLGDEIYGLLNFWRDGAAAEYVVARASDMAPKPRSLDFVQAAAIPLSGLTAWQALFDHAKLSRGDRVLIHGAGGGVGTFAVQLARWKGAQVIVTCSRLNANLAKGLGADEVIDYTTTRFDGKVGDFDAVLDTVGGDTLDRSWKVLRKGGTLVTIVGDVPDEKARSYGVRGVSMLVQPNRSQLIELSRLVDQGRIRPVVGGVFPLSEAGKAYEKGLASHGRGKLVLRVDA